MESSNFGKVLVVMVLMISISARLTHTIPINTDMLKFKEDTEEGTKEIEVHSDDYNMEETISNLYEKLRQLDVKALYKKRVMLKQLVNETEKQIADAEQYPEYVLSREEKIYFFTNQAQPANLDTDSKTKSGTDSQTGSDAEDREELAEALLEVAKKHTRNPPGLGRKKSQIPSLTHSLTPNTSNSRKSVASPAVKDISLIDQLLASQAGKLWRDEDLSPPSPSSSELADMINALQDYVQQLKSQLSEKYDRHMKR